MPRSGGVADLRWYEIEPCYVFHPWNAYEDGDGRIVLDVARYPELWRETANDFDTASRTASRSTRRAAARRRSGSTSAPIEFPRVDDRRGGARHRYGYTVAAVGGANEGFRGLLKYDFQKGGSVEHDFGPGCATGEGVFVPAGASAGEDEGFVLSFVYDAATNGSELVILDAHDFAKPPIAEVALPQRVPFGFHGNWVATTERSARCSEAADRAGRCERFGSLAPHAPARGLLPWPLLRLHLWLAAAVRRSPAAARRAAARRHREGRARAHRAHRGRDRHDRAGQGGRGAAAHPGHRRAHPRRAGRRGRGGPAAGRDRARAARLAGPPRPRRRSREAHVELRFAGIELGAPRSS